MLSNRTEKNHNEFFFILIKITFNNKTRIAPFLDFLLWFNIWLLPLRWILLSTSLLIPSDTGAKHSIATQRCCCCCCKHVHWCFTCVCINMTTLYYFFLHKSSYFFITFMLICEWSFTTMIKLTVSIRKIFIRWHNLIIWSICLYSWTKVKII